VSINPYSLFDEFTIYEAARALWDGEQSFEYDILVSAIQSGIDSGLLKCKKTPKDPFSKFEEQECNGYVSCDYVVKIKRNDFLQWVESKGISLPFARQGKSSDVTTNAEEQIKQLDPRKEKTLYCLIVVLAKKAGYSLDDKDTVGKIERLLSLEGVPMDNKTIRSNIKSAFEALNSKKE